jgi:hypothetical protein
MRDTNDGCIYGCHRDAEGDGGKRRGSGYARNNYQVGSPRSITHFTLNETLSGAPHVFTVYPTAAMDPDGSSPLYLSIRSQSDNMSRKLVSVLAS